MGTTESKHLQDVHRVTRIWRIPFQPGFGAKLVSSQERFRHGTHKPGTSWVILRQEDLGECRIYVDGIDTLSFKISSNEEVTRSGQFLLPDGQKCELQVKQNHSWLDRSWKFAYHLFANDMEVPELNDFHLLQKAKVPPFFTAAVVNHKKQTNAAGEVYISYAIEVREKDSAEPRIVQRRFRDFCMLDLCMRWSWNHHLHFSLDTLPKVPERRQKQANERMNEEFICVRQQKLEVYLKRLLQLPRAEENPDVLAFFEFVDALDDIAFSSDRQPSVNASAVANNQEVPETVNEYLERENAVEQKQTTVPELNPFEKLLMSIDSEQMGMICNGPSRYSQDYLSKLVCEGSVETILKGIFKVDSIKPLIRGFNQERRDKTIFNEQEFRSWCDSQLPSISDLLRDRVQLLCKHIPPKRPFPPSLDQTSQVIDDGALRFLTIAFTECYGAPTWNRLYASFADGLSFQTICTSIEGYEGATLLVIQDSQGCRFGALATAKWREETAFFSSASGALFSLVPVFRVFRRQPLTTKPKSKNVQYMNSRSRTLPLGMGFGGELHAKNAPETALHPRLWIDADFDTCFATSGTNDAVYDSGPLLGDDLTRETFLVAHLEIWGLGGEEGLKSRDVWRAQKDRMLLKQRQVDKAQFANNGFDREYLLNGTFNGNNRNANDN